MNEKETAFGPLQLRALRASDTLPADRISVRDYVRLAEIGAYACERGVSQRLRFNVVLEVSHHAAAREDDVDQVVSYDTIIAAIDRLLASDRLDLLETLAERLAQTCLSDARVLRTFIRIEKLDRIPGALGVEIVRTRVSPEMPRLHRDVPAVDMSRGPVDVIFLDADALRADNAAAWLDAIVERGRPAITCVGPRGTVPEAKTPNLRRIGYLAVETAALELAHFDGRFEVVATRAEMEWSLGARVWPIWAPARLADGARSEDVPDASRPAALAGWLSEMIEGRLILVTDAGDAPACTLRLPTGRPDLLAET